jgi:hypothetical protein
VSRRLAVREIADFSASRVRALEAAKVDVFVLYSREWDPPVNLWNFRWFRAVRHRFYGWEPPVSPREVEARFQLREVARWSQRGQWIAVYVRRVGARPFASSTSQT